MKNKSKHREIDETPKDEELESPDIQEMEEEMGTERHPNRYNRKKLVRNQRRKGSEE